MNFQFFKDSGDFSLGNVSVQPRRNTITANGAAIRVEPRVMAVMMRLKQAGGEVVSRETLIDDVWGDETPSDEALTQAISRLRRAVGDDSGSPKIIETIPKRGYRLMCAPGDPAAVPHETFGAGDATGMESGARGGLQLPGGLSQTHLLWAAIVILGGLVLYSAMRQTPKTLQEIEIFLPEDE